MCTVPSGPYGFLRWSQKSVVPFRMITFRRFCRRARRFALGILKRVKAKLDGRDLTSIRERIELLRSGGGAHESAAPGQHRERLDVREHVERVIKEAVSVDNLAVMCAPGPGLAPASPAPRRAQPPVASPAHLPHTVTHNAHAHRNWLLTWALCFFANHRYEGWTPWV